MSAELETRGPADPKVRDRWTLRSGESWQDDLGEDVLLVSRNCIGSQTELGLTLADAIELRAQLDQHITNVTPAPVPKTREEQAAFAQAWDAKVDASRAGSEVKTRQGTFPSVPYVRQEDGTWKPKYGEGQ